MSDSDRALILVSPCGCVTAAESSSRPKDVRDFYKNGAETGRSVEITTVGAARDRLTFDCAHRPKGGWLAA